MPNEVVFDIETIGEISDFSKLELTVVSIYEYQKDQYSSFEKNDLKKLWSILEKSDRLIGFNSEHFDIPILNKYYLGDLAKLPHLDIMTKVKESLGFRIKLKDIAEATLDNITKSGDGLMAQQWWKEGKIDLIKKYCEQDVRVTKEIYEFGKLNKQLFYKTLTGEITPFKVNFDWPPKTVATNKNINLTLPI